MNGSLDAWIQSDAPRGHHLDLHLVSQVLGPADRSEFHARLGLVLCIDRTVIAH